MTIVEWLRLGFREGWCSRPVCNTHDGVPMTPAEEAECEQGFDPCVHVVRLYEEQDFEPDPEAMSHFDRASMEAAETMGIEGW